MHIIWWPISLNRVAGSPAPTKAKTARQRRMVWVALRPEHPPFDSLRAGFLPKEARSGAPCFEDGFKRDISLLLLLGRRLVPAPALLGREPRLALARWEPGPGRFRSA